jgi:DNA-binding XRE family transcriptional regulator
MSTEQTNDENEKKNEARNLYFQTSLTQAQIAALIGVSQKTVSLYINENRWDLLQSRAKQAPAMFLEQMNSELQELNTLIASRPHGQRFPTMEEAAIRRRIMLSIASVKDRMSVGTHAEVLNNFIKSIPRKNRADAQMIVKYADEYLKGQMKMSPSSGFNNYSLPTGFDTAPGNTPPDSERSADLDEAA